MDVKQQYLPFETTSAATSETTSCAASLLEYLRTLPAIAKVFQVVSGWIALER